MKKGMLIVISGPSGAGKGTVIGEVLQKMPELFFSVSATTRSPRAGEKEGVDYLFVTRDEFAALKTRNEFLESAVVHGDSYGTPRSFVESHLSKGCDVVLDIDVQGGLQVKKNFPEGVFIFLVPPTFEELNKRLKKRHTENESEIKRRLEDAKEELRSMEAYEYLVTNDVLTDAVENVVSIIRAEQSKTRRRLEEVEDALSAR